MVEEGDTAPDFTVPMVSPGDRADRVGEYTGEDLQPFTLSDALEDGPVVLAFFPGAFSRTCTQEMCEFRDWLADVGELEGQVYGVSADMPWALLAYINEYDLNFPMLSGFNTDVIADYGVRREDGLLSGIANRSVFVVGRDRTVRYKWLVEEPGILPDLDDIRSAVADA